ncbi:hypothetical protein D3C84_1007090 [compost metagenome]
MNANPRRLRDFQCPEHTIPVIKRREGLVDVFIRLKVFVILAQIPDDLSCRFSMT